MDFETDLKNIAKKELDFYEVDYSKTKSTRELINIFVNLKLRLIQSIPRKVIKSHKIHNANYNKTISDALKDIENSFISGADVSPYFSKDIFKAGFTDYLFADWKINHLHLNPKIKDTKFVKRSKEVLFITIFQDTVYFIDIRPHGINGEKYVFAQKDLLQIIFDEWSFILEPYKTLLTAMAPNIRPPKDIDNFRKSGWTIPQEINGNVYAPMGGGITTANTSTEVSIETSRLYMLMYSAENYLKENRKEIDHQLSKISGYYHSLAKFHLAIHQNGCLILEETTQRIIKVFK